MKMLRYVLFAIIPFVLSLAYAEDQYVVSYYSCGQILKKEGAITIGTFSKTYMENWLQVPGGGLFWVTNVRSVNDKQMSQLKDGDQVCINGSVGWHPSPDVELLNSEMVTSDLDGPHAALKVWEFADVPSFNKWREPSQQYNPEVVSDGSVFMIKNVRWGKKSDGSYNWNTVQADTAQLSNVYWVKKPLPGWGGNDHALLMFTFKTGGLVNKDTGEQATGLALSVEARWRDDTVMNHDTAFSDTFNISWLLSSEEDYIVKTCTTSDKDNTLYPFELNISSGQKAALLSRALVLAGKNREGEFYNAKYNNCQTSLYRVLNAVLPEARRIHTLENSKDSELEKLLGKPLPAITPENYKNTAVWPK